MNKTENHTNSIQTEENLPECRVCLQTFSPEAVLYNLFEEWTAPWDYMQSTKAEDLAKLANIQLSLTDKYSKVICELCCSRLQNACDFVSLAQKNDAIIRQRYINQISLESEWPKPIQLGKNINGMDVEIKQEVLSDAEYDTNETEEAYKPEIPDLDIKIEPEEIIVPNPIQVTVNGTISEAQFDENKTSIITNGKETYEDETYLDSSIKEEPVSDIEDNETSNDLPLDCLLCTKNFNSISGLKAHVIAQHSYKTVRRKFGNNPSPEKKQQNDKYVCATCRRTFATSTDLMVHETCHNKTVCYGCNQKFDTFDQLTKHRRRCKATKSQDVLKPKSLEDVKRPQLEDSTTLQPEKPKDEESSTSRTPLKCPLCKDEFTESYYLRIHQEVHHSVTTDSTEFQDKSETGMETEGLESIFGR